ncbi:MAG: hypothetical protein WA840_22910 [Caulobacteraceae bacterium]
MLTPSAIIVTAGKRLTHPSAWTQNAAARDAAGRAIIWRDGLQWLPGAVAWCVGFALIDGLPLEIDIGPLTRCVSRGVGMTHWATDLNRWRALARWNDEHGRKHADVLAALRRAFVEAKRAEGMRR